MNANDLLINTLEILEESKYVPNDLEPATLQRALGFVNLSLKVDESAQGLGVKSLILFRLDDPLAGATAQHALLIDPCDWFARYTTLGLNFKAKNQRATSESVNSLTDSFRNNFGENCAGLNLDRAEKLVEFVEILMKGKFDCPYWYRCFVRTLSIIKDLIEAMKRDEKEEHRIQRVLSRIGTHLDKLQI